MTYEEFYKIREEKYNKLQEDLAKTEDKETKRMLLHNYNEEMRQLRHLIIED